MTFTTVMFPIIAALIAPEGKFLERNTKWNAANEQQKYFLENIFTKKDELSKFSDKELRCWASRDHNELNKIAKDNGFDIQLKPFGPGGFGSLSILDVAVKWLEAGTKTTINYNKVDYKGAKISKGITVMLSPGWKEPLISIETQNSDTVYITFANQPLEGLELLKKINKIKYDFYFYKICKPIYENLIFPVIDINQQVDISWLKNMTETSGYFINQALQQTKFKMDEVGAHVQSAVMLGFEKCVRRETNFVIDKPFYVWIERKGCSLPIFAAYIDVDSWQKA